MKQYEPCIQIIIIIIKLKTKNIQRKVKGTDGWRGESETEFDFFLFLSLLFS